MKATITPSTAHDQVVEPFTITYRQLCIVQLLEPPGLRIEGELDAATLPALTWALAAITDGSTLCVDAAALTFIDVGCLRALVTTAAGLERGHVLTLRSPSPQLHRVLALTGWQEAQLRLANPPLPALRIAPLRRLVQLLGLRPPPSLA